MFIKTKIMNNYANELLEVPNNLPLTAIVEILWVFLFFFYSKYTMFKYRPINFLNYNFIILKVL